MFTDVSSEAIAATLPLYVVFGLGLSPAAYGVVEAVYQASSALVRLAGGFAADRIRRYKPAATLGYGMSAACKIGYLAVAGAFTPFLALLAVDRAARASVQRRATPSSPRALPWTCLERRSVCTARSTLPAPSLGRSWRSRC
jgi:hypothetical protein